MKTLIFAMALVLSANTMALDIDRATGGMFYVSSYSSAGLFQNLERGEAVKVYAFNGPGTFCGIQALGNRLEASFSGSASGNLFVTSKKGMHLIACIKSSGYSGDVLLVIERFLIAKRYHENLVDDSDPYLLQQLEDTIQRMSANE